jgi:NAD(P)-dependent dehydrogenase (short-subunit alcohol dehydrogenase family)
MVQGQHAFPQVRDAGSSPARRSGAVDVVGSMPLSKGGRAGSSPARSRFLTDRITVNKPTDQDISTCLRVLVQLGSLAQSDPDDEHVTAARQAAAGLAKAARRAKRANNRAASRSHDTALAASTFVYAQPTDESILSALATPISLGHYARPRRCYVCKQHFTEVNSRYHLHCPACAAVDGSHRDARTDLTGRRVVITGGRVKIGFHLALKMLRDGAEVILTTRFPVDARNRFAAVPDSAGWAKNLTIYGLDLCDISGIDTLIDEIRSTWSWLDIVVFNAAATVRRDPSYYAREIALDAGAIALPSLAGRRDALGRGQERNVTMSSTEAQSVAMYDETGEALDLSPINSWILRLGEVNRREVLENYLVGAFAPFELLSALLPLLEASPHGDRHAVVVSAVEGQFAKPNKMAGHPHTNMTKAAANMMVRTCAEDLATRNIYVNSVDTGWITDENPHPKKERIRDGGFRPPLDVVDGAARIYHPIRQGQTSEPIFGLFLKNYSGAPW